MSYLRTREKGQIKLALDELRAVLNDAKSQHNDVHLSAAVDRALNRVELALSPVFSASAADPSKNYGGAISAESGPKRVKSTEVEDFYILEGGHLLEKLEGWDALRRRIGLVETSLRSAFSKTDGTFFTRGVGPEAITVVRYNKLSLERQAIIKSMKPIRPASDRDENGKRRPRTDSYGMYI